MCPQPPKKCPFRAIHTPKSNFSDLFGVENRGLQLEQSYKVRAENFTNLEAKSWFLVYQNIQNVFFK